MDQKSLEFFVRHPVLSLAIMGVIFCASNLGDFWEFAIGLLLIGIAIFLDYVIKPEKDAGGTRKRYAQARKNSRLRGPYFEPPKIPDI